MRQYCLCSWSKIQVLWHDSKTIASTTQPWSDGLNLGVEEPGNPLRTSLQLDDARNGATVSQFIAGEVTQARFPDPEETCWT
jgi:hypothetical protein